MTSFDFQNRPPGFRFQPPFRLRTAALIIGTSLLFCACGQNRLEWHQESGYTWAELSFDRSPHAGFTRLSPSQTGISKINSLTREQISQNRHLLNGSGVAIGDVDNDGLADVYLCQLNGANALYKNLGDWQFANITEQAGVACADQFSTGAVFADLDGDGDLDLLVTALGGPNACFFNDGSGKFEQRTAEAGLTASSGAMSAALADVDGDGDLDLYIVNNKKQTVKDLYPAALRSIDRTVREVDGRYEVLPEFKEHYKIEVRDSVLNRFEIAEPDMFFLNNGSGHFTPIQPGDARFVDENGKPAPVYKDWGLSARFHDLDRDGDPDLYVCNDFESPDRIWLNDGRGYFRALPSFAIRTLSASSMSVDFSDVNRDGWDDIFVTEMLSREHARRKRQQGPVAPAPPAIGLSPDRPQYMRNALYLNRGDTTFAEISQYAGIDASEWSWSPVFLDVDLDGFEDLLIVTGHYYDGMDMDAKTKLAAKLVRQMRRNESEVFDYPPLKLPNMAFRNRGDLRFDDMSAAWGFDAVDIAHGMATGDLDNDGDLDIIYNSLESEPGIYRNDAGGPRLAIRLRGQGKNTRAIGAKIRVIAEGLPIQTKEVFCGGPYLSGSDQIYSFATGHVDTVTIEIIWRNQSRSRISGARTNRLYLVDEAAIAKRPPETNAIASPPPLFEDRSGQPAHQHAETWFDDFSLQPLLPRRLSQSGPALAWLDIDGDGQDELFVTCGRRGRPALFQNRKGQLTPLHDAKLIRPSPMDQTAAVAAAIDAQTTWLFVAFANDELPESPSYVLRYNFLNGRVTAVDTVLSCREAIGPLALADYDADGDLDLFAGGRAIPGRYPEPASSYLLKNRAGRFTVDSANTAALDRAGLVSGAVFSDIDGDGNPDLLLALEWGPVRLLENQQGRYTDATQAAGLAPYSGWWNGINTGDFNEDGQPDIVATNWGLNSKYRASMAHPLRLYAGDFDRNGTLDVIEAYYDSTLQRYVPESSLAMLGPAMPFLLNRFRSFEQFSTAGVAELLGARAPEARVLEASTLATGIFLRTDSGFSWHALPPEAQFSPAFAACVADFDGDGHQDIFLSQNFFATNKETARLDAGRGLWLRGDGTGNFRAVPGWRSGIKLYGEQRSAAVADMDADGRPDLAVGQNGAYTGLFRNRGAKTGLRLRLVGNAGNFSAIGAQVRCVVAEKWGPRYELRAGSGYRGNDSATLLLAAPARIDSVWVRWPDGTEQVQTVESAEKEITIHYPRPPAPSGG